MSSGLPAIPIIGLPAKLANGLEQRWLRLWICHPKTINIAKGKDRSVATDGSSTERIGRALGGRYVPVLPSLDFGSTSIVIPLARCPKQASRNLSRRDI